MHTLLVVPTVEQRCPLGHDTLVVQVLPQTPSPPVSLRQVLPELHAPDVQLLTFLRQIPLVAPLVKRMQIMPFRQSLERLSWLLVWLAAQIESSRAVPPGRQAPPPPERETQVPLSGQYPDGGVHLGRQ